MITDMDTKIKHLKNNFYYVDVAKNGSSTLRNIKYFLDHGVNFTGTNCQLWEIYLYEDKYQDFLSHANNRLIFILRDPVDRIISYYLNLKKSNDKYKPCVRNFQEMIVYIYSNSFMSKQDPHIKSQVVSFHQFEQYITDIVLIDDLSLFLHKEVSIENVPIINSYHYLYEKYKHEFTNDLIQTIKDIYKEDYLLIEKCQQKIWKK